MKDGRFDFWFVLWFSRTRRQDGDPIVIGQLLIALVDFRLVVGSRIEVRGFGVLETRDTEPKPAARNPIVIGIAMVIMPPINLPSSTWCRGKPLESIRARVLSSFSPDSLIP